MALKKEKIWDGKIEKDDFALLQESSAKIMGLRKIRSLKFSGYLEAVKMNTPFILPSDRVFYNFNGDTLTEGISMNFEDGFKGGIIIFSTDVNATVEGDGLIDKIKGYFKGMFNSIANRLMNGRKLDGVLEKFEEVQGYSVGNFFRGRYFDRQSGKKYSEKSLSIEIIGVSSDLLVGIAEQIAVEFDQKEVLVKDHNNGKIFLVDRSLNG